MHQRHASRKRCIASSRVPSEQPPRGSRHRSGAESPKLPAKAKASTDAALHVFRPANAVANCREPPRAGCSQAPQPHREHTNLYALASWRPKRSSTHCRKNAPLFRSVHLHVLAHFEPGQDRAHSGADVPQLGQGRRGHHEETCVRRPLILCGWKFEGPAREVGDADAEACATRHSQAWRIMIEPKTLPN